MKTLVHQDVQIYTGSIVILAFGHGSKQQLDTQATPSIFGASWLPLGASWGHLGVLLGAIGGLKMTSFTQVY